MNKVTTPTTVPTTYRYTLPAGDGHVHCRGWAQSYKTTIKEVTRLARSQNVVFIIDMPNTGPAITTAQLVESRLRTAEAEGCLHGYYLFIGATRNPDQLREAFWVASTNPKVAGIKLYAGKTTGDLELLEEAEQRQVFKVARQCGYKGVIAVHCEKEKLARPELWVPELPATWNLAKPPEMEVEAIKDIIKFAREEGFEGHLHICHISTPESVALVDEARRSVSISCCITPHHLSFSTEDMQTTGGTRLKVNPPIREIKMMRELMVLLREGKINGIETDHAKHTPEEKTYLSSKPPELYMSGIPSLEHLSDFLTGLVLHHEFTENQVRDLTYRNIKRIFPMVLE